MRAIDAQNKLVPALRQQQEQQQRSASSTGVQHKMRVELE